MEQSPVETKPKKSAWRKARGAKKKGDKREGRRDKDTKIIALRWRGEERGFSSPYSLEDAASQWRREVHVELAEERKKSRVLV